MEAQQQKQQESTLTEKYLLETTFAKPIVLITYAKPHQIQNFGESAEIRPDS